VSPAASAVVALDGLQVAPLQGAAPVLHGIDLQVTAGEQVAVIGASGSGKTTLLLALAGMLRPSGGRLVLFGQEPWTLCTAARQRLRQRTLLAPQVPPLPPRQRVVTTVLAARLPQMSLWSSLRTLWSPRIADAARVQQALVALDLPDKLWLRVDRLSGGERQRVGLARLLVADAALWLVDEPLSALDPARAELVMRQLAEFVPPRHDAEFLLLLARETWRTVAIATAGMALAGLIALPLALAMTQQLSVSAVGGRMERGPAWLRQVVRAGTVVLRSVPELVWALVFVRVVGLGPTAGVLAIAIAYGGMLAKVWAEILESADAAPAQALLGHGAGRIQTLLFAALPQSAPELTSYTVYRWECAIRSSVVLGFVGAGGLGQQLDNAAKLFAGSEVSAILLVFMALVALSDRVSAWIRRGLA
jgi:phosphonate ABC transporter permease subunit PhnE